MNNNLYIRTVLIDPKAKRLKEVFMPRNEISSIHSELDCQTFTTVGFYPLTVDNEQIQHDIYCDDDGLFKEDQYFFFNKATGTPIAGKGLIVGLDHNTGNSRSCLWSIDGIKKAISWIGDRNTLQFMLERKVIKTPDFSSAEYV